VNAVASLHEDERALGPSDRSFGLTFAGIFLVIALLPLWRGAPPRLWLLAVAAACAIMALVQPRVLAPANRAWLRLGLLMHRVVNPVVMAVLFYAVVTPFGRVMRLFRVTFVRRLRPDPGASTYWIPREETRSSMEQQF
jgi:hypothetical protein